MKDKKSNPIRRNPFDSEPDFEDVLDFFKKDLHQISEKILKEAGGDPEKAEQMLIRSMLDIAPTFNASDWAMTHPNDIKCGSDTFYAKLASSLNVEFDLLRLDGHLADGAFYAAAQSIAAYLEDIISGTHVWQAVRNIYLRTYGKQLPFYEVDPEDYFDDDINIQDIKLIIWQALCRCGAQSLTMYSPISSLVDHMAQISFDLLVESFDHAPKATRVTDLIRKTFRSGDYYDVRMLALWLNTKCPLTAAPFAYDEIRDAADHTLDTLSDTFANSGFGLDEAIYFEECNRAWLKYMSLLGCHTKVLLSEIASLHNAPAMAEKILTVKMFPSAVYIIESCKGRYVKVRDLAGNERPVVKKSFGKGVDWDDYKSGLMNLVKFGDEYYQNGLATFAGALPKNTGTVDMVLLPEKLRESMDTIVRSHRGRRVFFCKTIEDVSKILGPVMGSLKGEVPEEVHRHDNYLLLISSTDGPIVMPDWCQVIEDKKNPFLAETPKDKLGSLQFAFMGDSVLPDDVIEYIVSHKMLSKAYMTASQGKRVGKALVQDNLTFLLRFDRVKTNPIPEYLCTSSDEDSSDDDD